MNHGDSRRTLAGTLVGHSGPETTRVALPHSQHPIVSYHPAFLARTVRVHAVQFGVLTEKCPCMVSTWPPVRQLHTCSHGGVHHPMRLRQPVQQQIKHRIRWPSGHIALTPCLKSGGCGNDVLICSVMYLQSLRSISITRHTAVLIPCTYLETKGFPRSGSQMGTIRFVDSHRRHSCTARSTFSYSACTRRANTRYCGSPRRALITRSCCSVSFVILVL